MDGIIRLALEGEEEQIALDDVAAREGVEGVEGAEAEGNQEEPAGNSEGKMDRNWHVHQMLTTANFSQTRKFGGRLVTWFTGCLLYTSDAAYELLCVAFCVHYII